MTPTILFHAVPPPLIAALAEQGIAAPAYECLVYDAAAAALPSHLRLVLSFYDAQLPARLAAWRQAGLRAPVLLCAPRAESSEDWEITEHLPLPLRLGALIARLRYYLTLDPPATLVRWGGHEIDPAQKILRWRAAEQIMTDKETAIMLLLAESGQPWGREDLLREIWGYDSTIDTHTLETHIYRLRRKLADLGGGGDIVTTPAGYQLSCG